MKKYIILIILLFAGCKTIDRVPSTVSIFYKGIMTNPNTILDLANNYPDFVDNKYLNDRMKDKEYLRKEKEFIARKFHLKDNIDKLICYTANDSEIFISEFNNSPILNGMDKNNIIRVIIRNNKDLINITIIKKNNNYYLFDLDSGSIAVL